MLRPLLLLVLLLAAALSSAQFELDDGNGHAKPTGGTYSVTQGPPPPYRTGPYTYVGGTYGNQNVSGGTVTLSGECVFHYRWVGAAGTAPSQAVVHITSNANWHDGRSGSAADGLGHAYVYTPPSSVYISAAGASAGEAYQVKQVGAGGTFDVKLTPNVSTDGIASVAVTVAVVPVVLTLTGPQTTENGGYECMIGRGVRGTLSAGLYSLDPSSYRWSIGGANFKDYIADNGQGKVYAVDAQELQAISPHWYWKEAASVIVSCTATISLPDGTTASVTGRTGCDVYAPISGFEGRLQSLLCYMGNGTSASDYNHVLTWAPDPNNLSNTDPSSIDFYGYVRYARSILG